MLTTPSAQSLNSRLVAFQIIAHVAGYCLSQSSSKQHTITMVDSRKVMIHVSEAAMIDMQNLACLEHELPYSSQSTCILHVRTFPLPELKQSNVSKCEYLQQSMEIKLCMYKTSTLKQTYGFGVTSFWSKACRVMK